MITWVDDTDPAWREKKAKYTGCVYAEGNTEDRYRDWDTLKYWFRGVEKYAPWVRYIWFVTDDQKPQWLNTDHPKLKWVKHTDYIPTQYLPTFHSNVIEWNLFRIHELAEQFVYFNDDMFLIDHVIPEDFFVKGLPCDLPRVDYLYPEGFFSYTMFNNTNLLNRHFSLKDSIKANWKKWMLYQTPKTMLKNLFFGRKALIPGFEHDHVHISLLKSTYREIWEKEYAALHETCTRKQRTKMDVSCWCIRDWQLLSGTFYPKKPCGKLFHTAMLEHSNEAIQYLKKQKGKVICLNDSENEKNFLLHKQMIVEAFEELLPEKSSFEI